MITRSTGMGTLQTKRAIVNDVSATSKSGVGTEMPAM
jgi:hypothetical protein